MKKAHVMIAAAIVSIGFTACQDKKSETTTTTTEVLNSYVDSVEKLTPVYTTAYWTAIDNGYQERVVVVEKDLATLTAEEKARVEAAKARYAALKSSYELKIRENEAPGYRLVLRNRLFGEGKIVGDDLSYPFITGANIKDVYENFVDIVSANKDKYTREEWDEIAALYGALDKRKEALEKEIDTKDNLLIAKLKVKYTAIYATHKYGKGDGGNP